MKSLSIKVNQDKGTDQGKNVSVNEGMKDPNDSSSTSGKVSSPVTNSNCIASDLNGGDQTGKSVKELGMLNHVAEK